MYLFFSQPPLRFLHSTAVGRRRRPYYIHAFGDIELENGIGNALIYLQIIKTDTRQVPERVVEMSYRDEPGLGVYDDGESIELYQDLDIIDIVKEDLALVVSIGIDQCKVIHDAHKERVRRL